MCLDITLETSLGSKIDPGTPICQDEGNTEENYCIQPLRKYPLATRRYNYLNSCQLRGMAISTFIPKLKKKTKEADIAGLRPEQLCPLMYITS